MGALDVPGFMAEILRISGGELDISNSLELIVTVTRHIDAFAIRTEADRRAGYFVSTFRCQGVFLSTHHIHKPKATLVDGDLFDRKQCLVILRPIGDLPATALIFNEQPVGRFIRWIHYVKIEVRPVAASRCRSEEHTSELQSHSFISYAVFC